MGNKAFDVTALGELLIDFTENGSSAQGIRYWKPIRAVLHATCLQCLRSLAKKLHSSAKSETTCSEPSLRMP